MHDEDAKKLAKCIAEEQQKVTRERFIKFRVWLVSIAAMFLIWNLIFNSTQKRLDCTPNKIDFLWASDPIEAQNKYWNCLKKGYTTKEWVSPDKR